MKNGVISLLQNISLFFRKNFVKAFAPHKGVLKRAQFCWFRLLYLTGVGAGILLLFLYGTLAAEPGGVTETIEIKRLARLYSPVVFDHLGHGENYGCAVCHHVGETGESVEDSEEAATDCLGCHGNSSNKVVQTTTGGNVASTTSGQAGGPRIAACVECHPIPYSEKEEDRTSGDKANPVYLYHIDQVMLLGAYHLQCVGCHLSEDVATGCEDCHQLEPEGRKLFRLEGAK